MNSNAVSGPRASAVYCAVALLAAGAAVCIRHAPVEQRQAAEVDVRPLTDGEMSSVLGAFSRPKSTHYKSCPEDCLPCTNALSPGKGTGAPAVNPTTGSLHDFIRGLAAGAVGGGVGVSFSYNSDLADGNNTAMRLSMGYGWTHNYEMSLIESGRDMMWAKGDGTVSGFRGRFGVYTPLSGEFATLVSGGPGVLVITTTSGTTYRFDRRTVGDTVGARWLIGRITDASGRITTFTYDGLNRLTSVADQFGNSLAFVYGAFNRLVGISDAIGRQTTFTYDAKGNNLLSVTTADGTRYQYTYTVGQQIATKSVVSPTLVVTERYKLLWDFINQRVQGIVDATGTSIYNAASTTNWKVDRDTSTSSSEMRYTPGTSIITDALGSTWRYTYDDRGLLLRVEAPLVGGQPAITTFTYDPATLLVATRTDALGRTTSYTYDTRGNTATITDAQLNVTTYSYTHPIPGLVTQRIDPDGRTWQWQYDAGGNLTAEIDPLNGPLGPRTMYTYDGFGRRASMIDRNGHVTTYAYDGQSHLINSTRDPGGLGIATTYTYDPVGRQTAVTDPRGSTTTFVYDAMDRLISSTNALGQTESSAYDERGNRVGSTDPRSNTTTYSYDARNRQTSTTDALGRTTVYTYDAANQLISTTDPAGRISTTAYDERHRPITIVTDAGPGRLNLTTRTQYDAVDNLVRTTQEMAGDGPDRVTAYGYDVLNRRTTETRDPGGLNLITRYDYAPAGGGGCGCNGTPGTGRIHSVTDASGKVMYMYYDALDRNTSTVHKMTDTADNMGDTDDLISTTTYDAVGNVIQSQIVNSPNPDLVTVYTYDALNRLTQERRDPTGANLTTSSVYDAAGNLVQSTSPSGNVTTSVYDPIGRLTSRSDSLGGIVTYTYDAMGEVLTRTDGNGNGNTTPYVYDAGNRLTTRYDALNVPSTYTYDPVNNLLSETDRNGHITTYQYDGASRRTSETDASGALNIRTEFTYDAAGNLRTRRQFNTTQSGPTTQVTIYSYDAVNRRISELHPDDENGRPRAITYTYDPVSRLATERDQNQDVTTYSYDDAHRLIRRSYAPSVGSPTFPPVQGDDSYTYDRASQRLSGLHHEPLPDPDVTTSYSYDGAARIISLSQDGRTAGYSYTVGPAVDRRETTYPSGRVVRYDYDQRARLSAATDRPSGGLITGYTYDAADRPITATRGNGVGTATTYDALDRATRIDHGAGMLDTRYGYDAEENPLFMRRSHAPDLSELYRYDAADRIIEFKRGTLLPDNSDMSSLSAVPGVQQRQTWTLDQAGNWLSNLSRTGGIDQCQDRFANKANELTGIVTGACPPPVGGAPSVPAYDDNGNLTADPTAPVGGGLQYDYDMRNRLTRVRRISDGLTIARYFYDSTDRRVRKVVTNSGLLDGATVSFVDASWRTLAEYDGVGTLIQEHTYGTGRDQRLATDRNLNADGTAVGPGDQRLYHLHDRVGSVAGLTDSAGGLREAYLYDAYGRQTVISDGPDGDSVVNWTADDIVTPGGASSFGNAAMFTGRLLDAETALYDYRHRAYDPRLGRFTARDPSKTASLVDNEPAATADTVGTNDFVQPEGLNTSNLYLYVLGRPTAATDAIGLDRQKIRAAAGDMDGGDTRHENLGQMLAAVAGKLKKGNCISEFEISGHGNADGMRIGSSHKPKTKKKPGRDVEARETQDGTANWVGEGNAEYVGKELNKLNFCCPCIIYLGGCNTGLKKGENTWPQKIADATGCRVRATKGFLYGSTLGGGERIEDRYDDHKYYDVETPTTDATVKGGTRWYEPHPPRRCCDDKKKAG